MNLYQTEYEMKKLMANLISKVGQVAFKVC